MRTRLFPTVLAAAAALACRAEDAPSLRVDQALANGRFTLEARPRYNRIDESNHPLRAEGVTMRTAAGWVSGAWRGLRLTAEILNASHLGPQHFNDDAAQFATSPYPLLPDPKYTGANRVHLDYDGETVRVRAGRQLVRLFNQRWVSDNDFRQIPQLFEGVAATWTPLAATELGASRFWRVRTTSGVTSPLALTLVQAAWNPAEGHSLGAYGVFHDQAQNGAFTGFANNSYRVVGLRAEGAFALPHALEALYVAEYAQQRPYAGGDARIDANYRRLGAGLACAYGTLRYDEEVKGSNNGRYGVQMPLTDFYAFNGWTLNFFNTPAVGLRDRWLSARATLRPVTLYAEAHRFRADFGGRDLGRELDAGLTVSARANLVARLQHARYDPVEGGSTIRKTWLTITYTY